ncbi:MAG: hypothetical protein Q7S40_29395 [Opitutaceae bacterium]|nr:hypothetical protein [Opitutaceae bacterium]
MLVPLAGCTRARGASIRLGYQTPMQIHVVLGQKEDALGILRELMTGPCFRGPQEVRHDPLWSRLNADPRFEEILKSAKPL